MLEGAAAACNQMKAHSPTAELDNVLDVDGAGACSRIDLRLDPIHTPLRKSNDLTPSDEFRRS
jgi:hypothetical protein